MPPCSPLSSTSPRGRANCACLTGTARGGRACAWAGTKERPPQRPNKGTGSRRRMTLREPLSHRDPNTEPLHENGASPKCERPRPIGIQSQVEYFIKASPLGPLSLDSTLFAIPQIATVLVQELKHIRILGKSEPSESSFWS